MNTLQERLRAMAEDVASDLTWCAEAADRIDADAERIKSLEAARAKDTERLATLAAKNIALEADALSDAQIERAVDAWFDRRDDDFNSRMRAAIDAARSKT